ncbi:MAG: DUF3179 domain-containing (seleno)protein [Acidimicrobiia bacterium]
MLGAVLAIVAVLPLAAAATITGDFSQMVYKPSRLAVYRTLRFRSLVIGAGVVLWLAALVIHLAVDETSVVLLVVTGVLVGLFTLLGFGMSPYVMFPSVREPSWAEPTDERLELGDDEPVIGVVVNDDARAFPVDDSFRPHLIEATIGGEPVVMSYCLLSNLGVAFKPELDGVPMRCIMPIQWENNMVIWDASGGRLVQQIEGTVLHGPGSGRTLQTYQTQIMPWSAWHAQHPDTKVFFNPPRGIWDRFVRSFIGKKFLEENRKREAPMFPTIERFDDRLPNKTEVIGVAQNDDIRAFPVESICDSGVVNDVAGTIPIAIACDDGGAVSVFARELDGETVELQWGPEGDLRDGSGRSWDGTGRARTEGAPDLEPFPHHSRVLWFVWANFHPETEVVA